MYKDIQLDNNSNYQQYAPYDIIAVDEDGKSILHMMEGLRFVDNGIK